MWVRIPGAQRRAWGRAQKMNTQRKRGRRQELDNLKTRSLSVSVVQMGYIGAFIALCSRFWTGSVSAAGGSIPGTLIQGELARMLLMSRTRWREQGGRAKGCRCCLSKRAPVAILESWGTKNRSAKARGKTSRRAVISKARTTVPRIQVRGPLRAQEGLAVTLVGTRQRILDTPPVPVLRSPGDVYEVGERIRQSTQCHVLCAPGRSRARPVGRGFDNRNGFGTLRNLEGAERKRVGRVCQTTILRLTWRRCRGCVNSFQIRRVRVG
jgi:hypothetical protein